MVCRVSFEWVKWHLSARSRYPRAVTCVTYRDEGKSFTKGCEGKSKKKNGTAANLPWEKHRVVMGAFFMLFEL